MGLKLGDYHDSEIKVKMGLLLIQVRNPHSIMLVSLGKGNLSRVHKLLTQVKNILIYGGQPLLKTVLMFQDNINCRDSAGRNSTPLHLAAGYNNLEVADHLLEQVVRIR